MLGALASSHMLSSPADKRLTAKTKQAVETLNAHRDWAKENMQSVILVVRKSHH